MDLYTVYKNIFSILLHDMKIFIIPTIFIQRIYLEFLYKNIYKRNI